MERILRGLPVGTLMPRNEREFIDQVWLEEIRRQELELAAEWDPSVPPEPESWPNYQLTRMRLIRRLSDQIWIRDTVHQSRGVRAVEQWLEDLQAGIRGRPDLIVSRNGGVCIIDLKSGAYQSTPTAQQRFQLLVYAHLFRSSHGELPRHLLVRNLLGEEFEVQYVETDVKNAYESCVQALQRYNELAQNGQVIGEPSAENCSQCNFRVCCPSFSQANLGDWTGTNTLVGTVIRTHKTSEGVAVDVRLRFPTERAGGASRLLSVAGLDGLQVDDLIGMSGFAAQSDWAMIRPVWNSLFWVKRFSGRNS